MRLLDRLEVWQVNFLMKQKDKKSTTTVLGGRVSHGIIIPIGNDKFIIFEFLNHTSKITSALSSSNPGVYGFQTDNK